MNSKNKKKLLELVKTVLKEVMEEMQNEENGAVIGNVTAAIDGYLTPKAFQRTPPTRADKKKQYSHLSSSAYTIPAEKVKPKKGKKAYSLYEAYLKN
jgi:hypothetical protein